MLAYTKISSANCYKKYSCGKAVFILLIFLVLDCESYLTIVMSFMLEIIFVSQKTKYILRSGDNNCYFELSKI